MDRILVPTSTIGRDPHIIGCFRQVPDHLKSNYFKSDPPMIAKDGRVPGYYDGMCIEAALFLGIKCLWVLPNWSE